MHFSHKAINLMMWKSEAGRVPTTAMTSLGANSRTLFTRPKKESDVFPHLHCRL